MSHNVASDQIPHYLLLEFSIKNRIQVTRSADRCRMRRRMRGKGGGRGGGGGGGGGAGLWPPIVHPHFRSMSM